ncbi:MAG: glutamine amidotransferase-related protein, partial [Candidatus Puniceispirillaceae bacterium]
MTDSLLIIDFGSQVTQLIARRLRELHYFTEIVPSHSAPEILSDPAALADVKGIILSGGPQSVTEADTPRAPDAVFASGVPVLGICYGQQTLCAQLGGRVEAGTSREFGAADITFTANSPLFDGLAELSGLTVWMSHGDHVSALPDGFDVIATSKGAPFAAIADEARR